MVLTRRGSIAAGESPGGAIEASGGTPSSRRASPRAPPAAPAASEAAEGAAVTAKAATAAPAGGSLAAFMAKWGDLQVRVLASLAMAAFYGSVVYAGHMWVAIFVVLMQFAIYREVVSLGYVAARDGRIPMYRVLAYHYYATAFVLMYGKSVLAHFDDQGRPWMDLPVAQYCLKHTTFIGFVMYCVGFMGFVLSLKPGQYALQFSYFARTHVALILVVLQSNFMILNVKHGLFWFVMPSVLVIINDSAAYVFGRAFGRHSLTSLSPKKTWEGFIGGAVLTMIVAFSLGGLLARYAYFACPKPEFTNCSWTCRLTECEAPGAVFQTVTHQLILPGLSTMAFSFAPVQLHAIALGAFASLIAPFGGLFASGVKRQFAVKDFGSLVPGHGGVTDRVDCQLLMAAFTYVYIINFVATVTPDVGKLLSLVGDLSLSEQKELITELVVLLIRRGVSRASVVALVSGTGGAAEDVVAQSLLDAAQEGT
ncbi:hypothetical protein MMPV_003893 [Pyropia vietnamensis]